jgi:hypothetical protein
MYCPKCGKENPDDARICTACNYELPAVWAAPKKITVKTSILAVASFLCGLASLILFLVAFFFHGREFYMAAYVVTAWFTLILGIISIFQIEFSAGKLTGIAFAVIGITIPVVAFLAMCSYALLHMTGGGGYRMRCGSNLSGIGKAMLIYANDYEDELPRAGGRGTIWQPKISNWQAGNRISAYGLQPDGTGGQASISASFYLLIKYAEITPKYFLCNRDKKTTEFKPAEYKVNKELIDLWDFGREPWKHCSYAYHMPYGPYALTLASEPGMAVAADRGPWIDSPFAKARDFRLFKPDGVIKQQKAGNCLAHQGDGQNVLFMDSHVYFQKRAFCGIKDDNIYTFWDGSNIRQGGKPIPGSTEPKDRKDSFLVHDPPVRDKK